MSLNRLLLWPTETQSHQGLSDKSRTVYLRITLLRKQEGGIFNHWLSSLTFEGCPLAPKLPAISCKLSKHLKLPCVSWANVYVMEVMPEAKIQTYRCMIWEAVSDDTELGSRWKNGMSVASVNRPSELPRDSSSWSQKSNILLSPSPFILSTSLQSLHTSSFTYLTYYISTANSHTISLLNRIYSPLINILQN